MKTTNIQTILETKYGVGIVCANWTTVTWAVADVEKVHGAEVAAKEMKTIIRIRERHGAYTNIPEFGTELFRKYVKK